MSASQIAIDPARLERALARLPARQRQAFLLKMREGLKYSEIGTQLGVTPESAEALVVAALIELDARLRRKASPWWRFGEPVGLTEATGPARELAPWPGLRHRRNPPAFGPGCLASREAARASLGRGVSRA